MSRVYVRFFGGSWDGRRVAMTKPLYPTCRVHVPRPLRMCAESEYIPTHAHFSKDEYHLERYTDHTGIPSWGYRLRRMVRVEP